MSRSGFRRKLFKVIMVMIGVIVGHHFEEWWDYGHPAELCRFVVYASFALIFSLTDD